MNNIIKKVFFCILTCIVIAVLYTGCASNTEFIQTDDTYEPYSKPDDAEIVFKQDTLRRPHQIIGVIEVELDEDARNDEFKAAMIKKAREIGADGVIAVKYDIDKEVHKNRYHRVVGRGWRRHHVTGTRTTVDVSRIASGLAIIFE